MSIVQVQFFYAPETLINSKYSTLPKVEINHNVASRIISMKGGVIFLQPNIEFIIIKNVKLTNKNVTLHTV